MILEKLKIYNTPAKLLARIREIKAEEEKKKVQIVQEPKRTRRDKYILVSTRESKATWATASSLKNIVTPKNKNKLRIGTSPHNPKFKELLATKGFTIKLDDDDQYRQELQKNKTESIHDMMTRDRQQIEVYNQEAMRQSQISHQVVQKNTIRKHHYQSTSSPQKQSVTEADQKQFFPIKLDDQEQERANFLLKNRIANKNLGLINKSDFRKTVKTHLRLQEYADLYQQNQNLYLSLTSSSQKNNIFQNTLGLIQDTNQIHQVNASGTLRNEGKLKTFQDAMRSPQCKSVTNLSLNQNSLTASRVSSLLQSFPTHIQELSLMNNALDSKAALAIGKHMVKSNIKSLNLENNRIGDIGCNYLTQLLVEKDTLVCLNLSRNQLTDQCSMNMSEYIKKTSNLYELYECRYTLYLHFNNLNSKAGINIWKALYKNSSIKVFDISHNRTGSLECAQNMAKVISRSYPELMHIDISHNGFDELSAQEISKALTQNQNIYGFHFEGNCPKYTINCNGHLIDKEAELVKRHAKIDECRANPPLNLKLLEEELLPKSPREVKDRYRISQTYRFKRIQGLRYTEFTQNADSCWICEGWQEMRFAWTPSKSGSMNTEPIFIHFNFEHYRPILMTALNGEFFLQKMCPPNYRVFYFFTNPIQGIQTTAKNQLISPVPHSDPLNNQQEFLYNGDTLLDGNRMQFVNELYTEGRHLIIDRYVPQILCKPREEEKVYNLTQFRTVNKNRWTLEKSIFKYYQPDNDALIDECFEFDFSMSKITRIVKENELYDVKEALRQYYPYLFTAFKFYASTLIGAAIPCISLNAFAEFVYSTGIIDKQMKITDVDLNFISTNGKDITYPNCYEKALVRYQFMEVLVRVAQDKYLRSGICKTMRSAIQRLFEEDGIQQRLKDFDKAQDWRDTRYWNEECDALLKERLPMLKLLFKYTTKLNPKTKYFKNPWVQSKDFRDMLNKCDIFCDVFVERDAYLAYLLSMMTQVDELFQSRHFQMEFYEFLEALARTAEKLSIIRTTEQMTIDERRQEPLHIKLDALTIYLYTRLKEEIKNTFRDSEDFSEFDSCMVIKHKSLAEKIQEIGNDDSVEQKPIVNLDQEEDLLHNQMTQVVVAPSTVKMSFIQVIRFAQQQKNAKNNFTLTNVVQYFKSREQQPSINIL